jgi:hypothetical protein
MLRKNCVGALFCVMAAAGLMLSALLFGCASAPPANVKSVNCEASRIDWEVAAEAEITEFSCAMGTHELEPSLIYTVALKNVSSSPQRFRLNIFLLDMDKAAGFMVPRTGKPPVLKPGEAQTVKIPFMKTTMLPAKTMVRVAPISIEE